MAAFNNPNLAILELVAQALGPVCESVIFVGGCATGLLLTQERPDAPNCRWVYKNVTLDLMPTVKDILGFANRWYPLALQTAELVTLPSGMTIKLITAPVFIGTKLEAFKDRGKDASGKPDFLGSHDLEDIITVADRRPELRAYLTAEFAALFVNPEFEQALSGHLPGDSFSQQRARPLANTLRELSKLST